MSDNTTTNADKSPVEASASSQAMPSRPSDFSNESELKILIRLGCLAILGLIVSFWIISILGCMMLYWGWERERPRLAVVQCVVFVGLIVGVHCLGYRLWRRHSEQRRDGGSGARPRQISSVYWPPMRTALLQQNTIIILASLVLDEGQAISMAIIAIAAYWLAFGIPVLRRPRSPTEGDAALIRYGFLLIFVAVILAAPIIGKALDRYP